MHASECLFTHDLHNLIISPTIMLKGPESIPKVST